MQYFWVGWVFDPSDTTYVLGCGHMGYKPKNPLRSLLATLMSIRFRLRIGRYLRYCLTWRETISRPSFLPSRSGFWTISSTRNCKSPIIHQPFGKQPAHTQASSQHSICEDFILAYGMEATATPPWRFPAKSFRRSVSLPLLHLFSVCNRFLDWISKKRSKCVLPPACSALLSDLEGRRYVSPYRDLRRHFYERECIPESGWARFRSGCCVGVPGR